ncbi:MAG TPA: CRISPR-associated endonuclease Cas1 [Stellaceae bacterium]|jgi:hypothetical protein
MLSLTYAMLTRHLTIASASIGLDPYRRFYHAPRYGGAGARTHEAVPRDHCRFRRAISGQYRRGRAE